MIDELASHSRRWFAENRGHPFVRLKKMGMANRLADTHTHTHTTVEFPDPTIFSSAKRETELEFREPNNLLSKETHSLGRPIPMEQVFPSPRSCWSSTLEWKEGSTRESFPDEVLSKSCNSLACQRPLCKNHVWKCDSCFIELCLECQKGHRTQGCSRQRKLEECGVSIHPHKMNDPTTPASATPLVNAGDTPRTRIRKITL